MVVDELCCMCFSGSVNHMLLKFDVLPCANLCPKIVAIASDLFLNDHVLLYTPPPLIPFTVPKRLNFDAVPKRLNQNLTHDSPNSLRSAQAPQF